MATTFFFKADGAVLMRVRISKRIEGVHREIMSSKRILTGLFISQKDWDDYHNLQSVNARDKYLERHPKFAGSIGKLQELRKRIDACGTDMNPQKMDDIITAVMNAPHSRYAPVLPISVRPPTSAPPMAAIRGLMKSSVNAEMIITGTMSFPGSWTEGKDLSVYMPPS